MFCYNFQRTLGELIHAKNVRSLSLLSKKAFINGEWVDAISGKTFGVKNPSNLQMITEVPDMAEKDISLAVQAAADTFQSWQFTTAKERSSLLRRWFEIIDKNKEDIAKLISEEAGKPFTEALGEVNYGNSFVEWFSEEARRVHGEIIQSPTHDKELMVVRQPIGVVGLITPWNFPIAMITRKAAAALAVGCTCVIKPAEDTPLTALALAKLAEKAGLPKGTINVITTSRENASCVGNFLCESKDVAGISFTGSTNVGKLLYQQCAQRIKRLALELGGNAPFIVFQSADINKAVDGAMASKFRNCGQTCVSANRFLIQEKVFEEFVETLKRRISQLLFLSDGTISSSVVGPLINKNQLEKVHSIVTDAVKKGAKLHLGGKCAKYVGELYFEPTLLTQITPEMRCYNEEIFGPVVSCISFREEEQALSIANTTDSGLAGYFYSNDVSQIWRVAKQLSVGMVGINEGLMSTAEAPFGGVKESGLGREGSHYGIDEFTYIKYMCLGSLATKKKSENI